MSEGHAQPPAPQEPAAAELQGDLESVVRGRGLVRRLVIATFVGVAIFVGFSVYADAHSLGQALRALPVRVVVLALALAFANYLLRFLKWHYYLGHLRVRVPVGTSLLVFLAGLVMSVTPGKLGELLKAYLLHEAEQVPMARTAPVVIAERLTDLIALLLLTLVGVLAFQHAGTLVAIGGALTVGAVVVAASPRLAEPLIRLVGRIVPRLERKLLEAYGSMRELVQPSPLLVGTVLSLLAWFAECLAFYLVVAAWPGVGISVRLATFVYAATTVAGALSFLPGGLGVTESSMMLLLQRLATGIGRATAVAATLVIRLCTLWFAVAVGLVALLVLRRKLDRAARAAG